MAKKKKLPKVPFNYNQNSAFAEHDLRMKVFTHASIFQNSYLPPTNPKVKEILDIIEEDPTEKAEYEKEAGELLERFQFIRSALYHLSIEEAWERKLNEDHEFIEANKERRRKKNAPKLTSEDRKLLRKTGKTKLQLNEAFLEIIGEMKGIKK